MTGELGGTRLRLDIWHPECWTLEVTGRVGDASLLGHGVHDVDGRARGRFTAYGDTSEAVDTLVAAIRDSPLTEAVWEVDQPRGADGDLLVPGSAARALVVEYDLGRSINEALVSRGFIPDEPVRMEGGREVWPVVTTADRDEMRTRLDAVRAEMDAEVRVEYVVGPSTGLGDGSLPLSSLTERQREVFDLARERGYYTWPREASAADLADELGVAKTTLLEHLRKAESKLLDPPGR